MKEIFFRGWLQNALEGELGPARRWLAPVLGAFAFAVLRTPLAFAPTFVLGLTTGLFYARSRSIAPCVVVHAAYAAVAFAAR